MKDAVQTLSFVPAVMQHWDTLLLQCVEPSLGDQAILTMVEWVQAGGQLAAEAGSADAEAAALGNPIIDHRWSIMVRPIRPLLPE